MESGKLDKIKKRSDQKLASYKALKRDYWKTKSQLKAAEGKLENAQEAIEIVQTITETIQQEVHSQIAHVVCQCLEIVAATGFEEPYTFKILFEQKRNRTEARLVFERNGMEIDPMSAAGGGAVDVAAFALRLSCLVLHKPKLNPVLILDEPFKFVSQEYRANVREMLQRLSEEMGIQMIMVTHIPELVTGKEIRL